MATRPKLGLALFAALFIGLLSVASSCSGGAGHGGDELTVEFSGEWEGTWSSSNPGPSGTLTLQLEQVGPTLTGTATFTGHSCLVTCSVACQVKGEEISGQFYSGPLQMVVHGLCSGPHHDTGPHHASILTGTYEILGGLCVGEHGTIYLMPVVTGEMSAPETSGVYLGEVILIGPEEGELVRIPVFQPELSHR